MSKKDDASLIARAASRRVFVKGIAASSSIVVAPAFIRSAVAEDAASMLFPLGVGSGDPDDDSVVLWTRLAEDPLAGGGLGDVDIPVGWEVATDPGMRHVIRRGHSVARARNGQAVRVVANRLPAGEWLYYRFFGLGKYKGHQSRIGRTRTFPSAYRRFRRRRGPNACRMESMRFASVSCQNYTGGFYPAWADIAKQDLDFVCHLGDYMYESGASSSPTLEGRNHTGGEVFSVEDYRNRYALYRLDADLQDAHARFPFIVTWDDHEADNNYAAKIAEEGAPFEGDAFVERRRNAYQVYGESMPLRPFRRVRRNGSFPLARKIEFGRLADIHVLDTRQFRTDQPAGDNFGSTDMNIDPATAGLLESIFGEQVFDTDGILDPSATLLGRRQEIGLSLNLIFSRARWNVLAQQIMVMPWNLRTTGVLSVQLGPDFPGKDQAVAAIANLDNILNVDAWDGYPAARDRLFRILDYVRPGNPVVLTGDIHSSWAANLLDDFGDPQNSDVLAAEFVCTSISSTFGGADPRPTDFIVRAGIPENPHIRYFDGRFRGYALCDVDAHRWRTEFRAVGAPEALVNPDPLALIPRAGDPVFTAAVAEIEAGFNARGDRKELSVVNNVPG